VTSARALGMRTVYVSDDAAPGVADVVVPSILALEDALPGLLAR